MKCRSCGFENPANMKFCGACGSELKQTGTASRSSPSEDSATSVLPEAERRQITIIFADLVGSTELAGSLDPEDLRTVIHSYQEACVRVMRRFEGHIAKYMGDGILVYFGYPVAHEDDARRAVQSGLGMLEAVQGLNAKFEQRFQIQLKARIGVHTGIVVAGDMGTTSD